MSEVERTRSLIRSWYDGVGSLSAVASAVSTLTGVNVPLDDPFIIFDTFTRWEKRNRKQLYDVVSKISLLPDERATYSVKGLRQAYEAIVASMGGDAATKKAGEDIRALIPESGRYNYAATGLCLESHMRKAGVIASRLSDAEVGSKILKNADLITTRNEVPVLNGWNWRSHRINGREQWELANANVVPAGGAGAVAFAPAATLNKVFDFLQTAGVYNVVVDVGSRPDNVGAAKSMSRFAYTLNWVDMHNVAHAETRDFQGGEGGVSLHKIYGRPQNITVVCSDGGIVPADVRTWPLGPVANFSVCFTGTSFNPMGISNYLGMSVPYWLSGDIDWADTAISVAESDCVGMGVLTRPSIELLYAWREKGLGGELVPGGPAEFAVGVAGTVNNLINDLIGPAAYYGYALDAIRLETMFENVQIDRRFWDGYVEWYVAKGQRYAAIAMRCNE